MAKIMNQDIFIAGITSDGREISQEDIEMIVSNTLTALNYGMQIPIKLGHMDLSEIAKGYAVNIAIRDNKIVADFVDIPGDIANFIKEGRLPGKSIELAPFVLPNGEVLERVITAVALLGTSQPAIPWLNRTDQGGIYSIKKDTLEMFEYNPEDAKKRKFSIADVYDDEGYYACDVRKKRNFDLGTMKQIEVDIVKGIYAVVGFMPEHDKYGIYKYLFSKDRWPGLPDVANWLNLHLQNKSVYLDDDSSVVDYDPYHNINKQDKQEKKTMEDKIMTDTTPTVDLEKFEKLNNEHTELFEKYADLTHLYMEQKKEHEKFESAMKEMVDAQNKLVEELEVYKTKEIEYIFEDHVKQGKVLPTQKDSFIEMYNSLGQEKTLKFFAELPARENQEILDKEITHNEAKETDEKFSFVPKEKLEQFKTVYEGLGMKAACKAFGLAQPK